MIAVAESMEMMTTGFAAAPPREAPPPASWPKNPPQRPKVGDNPFKSLDSRKKKDLDFLVPGLDFLAPGLELLAPGLEFLASGLEILSCVREGRPRPGRPGRHPAKGMVFGAERLEKPRSVAVASRPPAPSRSPLRRQAPPDERQGDRAGVGHVEALDRPGQVEAGEDVAAFAGEAPQPLALRA